MGKKMKLPNFLSKNNGSTTLARSSSWPWPSCHQPRTPSFRTSNITENNTNATKMLKTINSAYNLELLDGDSSLFTTISDSAVEGLIKRLKSERERLFFEPGETSSILEEAKAHGFPFKKSVILSMESRDPYIDFRKSMEEMVEAHGLKDWEDFEELLSWYLRVNGKSNHGYIVRAFVDLLVAFAFASSSSSSSSTATTTSSSSKINTATSICSSSSLASACSCSRFPASPLSFYFSSEESSSTPCAVSLLEADEEEEEEEEEEIHSYNSSTNPCLSSLLEAEDEIQQRDDAS